MGLRQDFLIHKRKTVESFRLVRADISLVNINAERTRNILSSIESRISAFDDVLLDLRKSLDKFSADINIHQNNSLNVQSKVEYISKSIVDAVAVVNSLKNRINKLISKNQRISKNISSHSKSIKKLLLRSKSQTLKNRQLGSALSNSQEEIKNLKNFLNRKLRTVKRRDLELETRLKKQRRTILTLNKKIKVASK